MSDHPNPLETRQYPEYPEPKAPLVVDEEGNSYIPRILVAFGDPNIVLMLVQRLRQAGYLVAMARDGSEAWEKVRSELPDLLVMDTVLPSIDGFQVVERMKSAPSTAEIPVVFLHTQGQAEDPLVFRYFRSGADCFLTAPCNPLEILWTIRRIFQSLRPRPPRSESEPEKPFI